MKIYGIKNCDSMKKAFTALDKAGVNYEFVDFKKYTPSEAEVKDWFAKKTWEVVINKKGMMWKKISEDERNNMTEKSALKVAQTTPTIIKRPLVVHGNKVAVGLEELAGLLK